MADINIKRIQRESYEEIKWYLDAIMPYVNFLNDLCFVDYEGVRYMITQNGLDFIIVANENGELNPYRLRMNEEGKVIGFSTELFEYDLSLEFDEGVFGVRKDCPLTGITEQLVYFPNDEELDVTSIDFYQIHQPSQTGVIASYELPGKNTELNYGLNYSYYHQPTKLVLLKLKKILGLIEHMGSDIFFKTEGNDLYRKNLFLVHNILIPKPFVGYKPDILLEQIKKSGYKVEIPDDLKGMIRGDNPQVKTLEYVSKTYADYTKGH